MRFQKATKSLRWSQEGTQTSCSHISELFSLLLHLERKGHLSHSTGTQRAPNTLPCGHICFSVCITFPQGSPETMVCLCFLPFVFISLASEPSLARSTLTKGTEDKELLHPFIIGLFRPEDIGLLNWIFWPWTLLSILNLPALYLRSLKIRDLCEISSVSFDTHTNSFRFFTLSFFLLGFIEV